MTDDTSTTRTTVATPRETAFAEAAEALQTMATGSMALLSAVYRLIDEASKKEPTKPTVDSGQTDDTPPTTAKAEHEPAPVLAPMPSSKAETPATATPVPTITPDTITKACVALIKHDRANSQRIQALLQTYGVSQMSALDPDKYGAFLSDLDAFGS